jgi:hypothetical protein
MGRRNFSLFLVVFGLFLPLSLSAQASRDRCLEVASIDGYVGAVTSTPLNRPLGNLLAYQVGNEVRVARIDHSPQIATYDNNFRANITQIGSVPVPPGYKVNMAFAGAKLAITFEAIGQSSAANFVNTGELSRLVVYDTTTGELLGGNGLPVPFEPNLRTSSGIKFYPSSPWAFRNWQPSYCSGQGVGQLGYTVGGFKDGRLLLGNWIQYQTNLGPEYTSRNEVFCTPPEYKRHPNGDLMLRLVGLEWVPIPFTAAEAWPMWGMSNPGFRIMQASAAGTTTLQNTVLSSALPEEDGTSLSFHQITGIYQPAVDPESGTFALPINFGVAFANQTNYGGVYLYGADGAFRTFFSPRSKDSFTGVDGAVSSIGTRPFDQTPRYAIGSPKRLTPPANPLAVERGSVSIVNMLGESDGDFIGRNLGDLFGRSVASVDQFEDGYNEVLVGAPNGIGSQEIRTGYVAIIDSRRENDEYAYVITPPASERNFGRLVAGLSSEPNRAASLAAVFSDTSGRIYDLSTCMSPAQIQGLFLFRSIQARSAFDKLTEYRRKVLRSNSKPARSYVLPVALSGGLKWILEAPYAKHLTMALRNDTQLRTIAESSNEGVQTLFRNAEKLEALRKQISKLKRQGNSAKLRRAKGQFSRLVKATRSVCLDLAAKIDQLRGSIDPGDIIDENEDEEVPEDDLVPDGAGPN